MNVRENQNYNFSPLKEYEGLELSTQILIAEALSRNIKVEVIDWDENFLRLSAGNNVEYVKQATKTSLDTYISQLIMENKHVTKLVLSEAGFSVPEGSYIKTIKEGLQEFDKYKNTKIVVKPKSTNFGEGITILKENFDEKSYVSALKLAFDFDSYVLIEKFFQGKEYRFLVIEDQVIGVLHRVPANVEGDSVHSVEELVHQKNKNPLRGKKYVTPLEKIKLENTEADFLKAQGLTIHSIPGKDERIFLRENSNISTGGDSIDYTDEIHSSYKDIAVAATKALGAKISGADIIIKDISKAAEPLNYSIIEVNFNPAIHIHCYPFIGKNRHPERKILDLLFKK